MPHGRPDDSNIKSQDLLFTQADLAEHAVRLGSPLVYQRSGNVLYIKTFGDGLNDLNILEDAAGDSVSLANNEASFDGVTCRLESKGADGERAGVDIDIPPITLGHNALQVLFKGLTGTGGYRLRIDYNKTGTSYEGMILIDKWDSKILYYDSDGSAVVLEDDIGIFPLLDAMLYLKLVVDLNNYEYRYLWVNDTLYDMRGLGLYEKAAVTAPYLTFGVDAVANRATSALTYIDSLIVTTEEP